MKEWDVEKEMIIASNRSLAEFNLSKEPELEEMKQQILEKSEAGEQLCTRIQELLEEYSKLTVIYKIGLLSKCKLIYGRESSLAG